MAGPKTAPLEPKIVDRLLDLLSDSDKFRELFQQSPATALELLGHVDPIEAPSPVTSTPVAGDAGSASVSVASCLSVNRLASKEAIQSARRELRSMLLSGLGQISPNLDATYQGD